jgi:hypothetical protein
MADNFTTLMCRMSWNLGVWTSWSPQSLSRPVQGLLYPYSIYVAAQRANGRRTWHSVISIPCSPLQEKGRNIRTNKEDGYIRCAVDASLADIAGVKPNNLYSTNPDILLIWRKFCCMVVTKDDQSSVLLDFVKSVIIMTRGEFSVCRGICDLKLEVIIAV